MLHILNAHSHTHTLIAVADPGGIQGCKGTPLSVQLSNRNVCTVTITSLDGTPLPHEQQSYYGCSSPTSDLDHFLVDYLPQSLTDC